MDHREVDCEDLMWTQENQDHIFGNISAESPGTRESVYKINITIYHEKYLNEDYLSRFNFRM